MLLTFHRNKTIKRGAQTHGPFAGVGFPNPLFTRQRRFWASVDFPKSMFQCRDMNLDLQSIQPVRFEVSNPRWSMGEETSPLRLQTDLQMSTRSNQHLVGLTQLKMRRCSSVFHH